MWNTGSTSDKSESMLSTNEILIVLCACVHEMIILLITISELMMNSETKIISELFCAN